MMGLRRFVEALLARALYSPFGLAWLRARQRDLATDSFRDAPVASPPSLIGALRLIQTAWPGRRAIATATARQSLLHHYPAGSNNNDLKLLPALTHSGPVICVSGNVTEITADALLLALGRAQLTFPEAGWRFDLTASPPWLINAVALSVPGTAKDNARTLLTLTPPTPDAIDAFVARVLEARALQK